MNNVLKSIFRIRVVFCTLALSFFIQSKFTNSFELDSFDDPSDSTDLFARSLPSSSLSPISTSSFYPGSLPVSTNRKENHQPPPICSVECIAAIIVVLVLISTCLICIIHDYISKKKRKLYPKKFNDAEFGSNSSEEWEKEKLEIERLERQQIINEKKKRMSYKQNPLPTIYEEHETTSSSAIEK